jgi:guanylate kinase
MMSSTENTQTVSNTCGNPLVIIISGPSGVGKDAILNRLKARKSEFEFITTVTTRRQRANEKNQVDYHFISEEEYQQLIKNNGLLESARVYGNWYGVPKQPIREALAKGKDTIVKVDVQGAATIKQILPEAVFIFIAPLSLEELSTRLNQRGSETASDLAVRLKTAEDEIKQIYRFDYVVYNRCNEIDLAIEQIRAIVTAEKCRAKPRKIVL